MPEGLNEERQELLADIADARAEVDSIGLRRFRVYVRQRVWYDPASVAGGPWTPGKSSVTAVPVDTIFQIVPTPRVRHDMDWKTRAQAGGTFKEGAFIVDKITPRTEVQGGIGYEIWQIIQLAAQPGTEAAIVIESRSGTAWHVFEGTPQLLIPGAISVAGAITCANALKAAFGPHVTDTRIGRTDFYGAHTIADTRTITSPDATDQASAITLVTELQTKWAAHRADLSVHVAADPYPLVKPAPTDAQSLLVAVNELLAVYDRHVAAGPVYESTVVRVETNKAFQTALRVTSTRRTP